MPNNRGNVWGREEVLLLLNIWRDEDVEGQLQGMHRNMPIYSHLAELLRERGNYERTPEQCRTKLKTLKSEWVKAKTNFGKSGTSGRNNHNIEEFEILNDVLSARPIHNPLNIVDTLAASATDREREEANGNANGEGEDEFDLGLNMSDSEEASATGNNSGSQHLGDFSLLSDDGFADAPKGNKRTWSGRLFDDESLYTNEDNGKSRPHSRQSNTSNASDGNKSSSSESRSANTRVTTGAPKSNATSKANKSVADAAKKSIGTKPRQVNPLSQSVGVPLGAPVNDFSKPAKKQKVAVDFTAMMSDFFANQEKERKAFKEDEDARLRLQLEEERKMRQEDNANNLEMMRAMLGLFSASSQQAPNTTARTIQTPPSYHYQPLEVPNRRPHQEYSYESYGTQQSFARSQSLPSATGRQDSEQGEYRNVFSALRSSFDVLDNNNNGAN